MFYFEELTKTMTWLGEQSDTIFLGQSVRYTGNAIYKTLSGVPMDKRIEMPVAEDMQLGISVGLSLTGLVPISIFPRMDFMMCCMNQLVNHLDKMPEAKVIIRVGIGATKPLYPGAQHCGDYSSGIEMMLKNVRVIRLMRADDIMYLYTQAYDMAGSTILVEYGNLY